MKVISKMYLISHAMPERHTRKNFLKKLNKLSEKIGAERRKIADREISLVQF